MVTVAAQDIKSFEWDSEVDASDEEAVIGHFKLRGQTFDVVSLNDSNIAYLVHRTRSSQPDVIISAVLDFTERALTEDSASRFADVVLQRGKNGLKIAQIVEVFEHILGIVTSFPTGSPKPSSTPRRRTGSGSRAN